MGTTIAGHHRITDGKQNAKGIQIEVGSTIPGRPPQRADPNRVSGEQGIRSALLVALLTYAALGQWATGGAPQVLGRSRFLALDHQRRSAARGARPPTELGRPSRSALGCSRDAPKAGGCQQRTVPGCSSVAPK